MEYYILPCYPALAILVGAGFARCEATQNQLNFKRWLIALTAIIFISLAIFFWNYSSTPALPLTAIVGAAILLWMIRSNDRWIHPFLMAGIVASILLLLPASAKDLNSSAETIHRFAQVIASTNQVKSVRVGAGLELAVWHADLRFYTDVPVQPLEDAAKVRDFVSAPGPYLLLIPQGKLQSISFETDRKGQILQQGPYWGRGFWNKNLHRRKQQTIVLLKMDR